jgi:hypothetical protein
MTTALSEAALKRSDVPGDLLRPSPPTGSPD